MNTMSDLQIYLSTTQYDITILHLTASYCYASSYMPALISIIDISSAIIIPTSYTIIHSNTKYNTYIPKITTTYIPTYQYIQITSPEIIQFYKKNLIKDIPYFLTFKKKYPNLTHWWYPCKNISALASMDDITLFVQSSFKL